MQRPEIIRHPHLDERTVQFGMLCMWTCEQLPQGYAGRNVADQLFRSGTSVAANYAEACDPESDADFIHKLKLVLKELKESKVWLRYAYEIVRDDYILSIIGEVREIRSMIVASMKTRGYTGWTSRQ